MVPPSSRWAEPEAMLQFCSFSSRKYVLKFTNKNFTLTCTPVQPFSRKSKLYVIDIFCFDYFQKNYGNGCASKRCQKIKFFLDLLKNFCKRDGCREGTGQVDTGFCSGDSKEKKNTWKI